MSLDSQVESKILALSAVMSASLVEDSPLEQHPYEQHPLVTKEAQQQKKRYEVEGDLRSFVERIATGLKEIDRIRDLLATDEPKLFTVEVLESIRKLCLDAKVLQKVALGCLLDKEHTKAIKDILGINAQVLRALYRAAAAIYNEGRFQEAAAAFAVVTLMDIPAHDAWLGLGNSEFYCQRYQSALIAYAMAVWSDPTNPVSHFYAAHCYEALKQYEKGINSLDIAMFVLKDNPKFLGWELKAIDHRNHLEHLLRSR